MPRTPKSQKKPGFLDRDVQ